MLEAGPFYTIEIEVPEGVGLEDLGNPEIKVVRIED
jgi:hypothetical protein